MAHAPWTSTWFSHLVSTIPLLAHIWLAMPHFPTVLGNPTLAAVVVPHDTDPMFIREVAAHLTIHAASLGEKNIHNGKLLIYEVTVQVTFTDEA